MFIILITIIVVCYVCTSKVYHGGNHLILNTLSITSDNNNYRNFQFKIEVPIGQPNFITLFTRV